MSSFGVVLLRVICWFTWIRVLECQTYSSCQNTPQWNPEDYECSVSTFSWISDGILPENMENTTSSPVFGSIVKFSVLSLDVSGTIPASLSTWTALQEFVISNTKLSGTIPSSFFNVDVLTYARNRFHTAFRNDSVVAHHVDIHGKIVCVVHTFIWDDTFRVVFMDSPGKSSMYHYRFVWYLITHVFQLVITEKIFGIFYPTFGLDTFGIFDMD
eukprot:PhF_6_TR18507/c0_g1_i1/m.27050